MRLFLFVAGLGTCSLAAAPVLAQSGAAADQTAAPGSTTFEAEQFIGRRAPGVLRASDFVGRAVYRPDNTVVGKVDDVLFGPDGRISGLVIETGGTLGIGERKIGVPIQAFRIDPGTTATTGTVGGLPPSTEEGVDTRQHNRISPVVYPDRIILPIPLERLRSAPTFQD